ncbi:putative conserved secreted protein [Synechococcus sp. NOUM97013]|nr:putative conserved secreted protein [Synechococcus sp. NOUM97013]
MRNQGIDSSKELINIGSQRKDSMKRIFLLCSLIALGSSPALARPWVYLTSFSYGGTGEQCLGAARSALANAGFTREEYTSRFDNQKGGLVEALLTNAPVRAKIECDPKLGITSLAVSGLNNDLTYEKYMELFKAEW